MERKEREERRGMKQKRCRGRRDERVRKTVKEVIDR